MNALERLRTIERGLDVTISTFPHQVEINRIRRRIALHRDVHTFFQAVGDIIENFDEMRTRYTMYIDFWSELKTCIENNIHDQIDLFTNIFPNNDDVHHPFPILLNGFLSRVDINTANFLSHSFRVNRTRYSLSNIFVSQRLLDNPFYTHASENLKQLITDFIYCTIVFPKTGGLVFSFQHPQPTQIAEEFQTGQQIVLFVDEYEDNFTHVVPIVPFVYYGGSYDVLDPSEYNMALPLPILMSDIIPSIPFVATNEHVTSILHDHDLLFRLNTTPLPENDVISNQYDNLVQQIHDVLNMGRERTLEIPNTTRVFITRRSVAH